MIRLRRRISGFGSQLQASSMPGDRGLSPCLRSEDRGLVENFPNPRAWSLWGQSQHALFRGFDQLWVVQQGVVLALVPVREHVTPVLTIRLARLAGCKNRQRLIPIAHIYDHPVRLVGCDRVG